MHSTRVVTFLLGAWIMGTLTANLIAYANLRLPAAMVENAPPGATRLIGDYGPEQSLMFLHFFAAESDRIFMERWEMVAIGLGVLLVPSVLFAADRRIIPTTLASFMLALALFQYFSVDPELGYQSRQVDFPPGRGNVAIEARVATITKMHVATEVGEAVLGMILAAYVMGYKSRRRTTLRALEVPPVGLKD